MKAHTENVLDSALAVIGLQRRRSAPSLLLPALGFLGLGLLVGAGTGLLFAPKRGATLRRDIVRSLKRGADRLRRGKGEDADAHNGLDHEDLDGEGLVGADLNNSAATF